MAENKEKIIELKNVGVTYKERKSFFKSESYQALNDVSFDVYKGETLGIIGRNGAGKSTLLRLLAGIIKPDKGEVIHHCKSVSLMALAAGFDPNLSGRQNAMISGMLIGHTKSEMLKKLHDIKEFSELGDFFEKPVKTFSSGMRARLGFSTAMHTQPDVLLIDEVLAVGDANFKEKAETAITQKINSDITVIIVSHSEQQIKRLAERVIWVEGGYVHKADKPTIIFPEYNTNLKMSLLGLKIEYYENYGVIFEFENIRTMNSSIKFNIIIIDFYRNSLKNVYYNDSSNNKEMVVPMPTPAYYRKYPKISQAKCARYLNIEIPLNKDIVFERKNNDSYETILSFQVSFL